MPVPNTFANATATIPLSQLDANFATTITLGNTAIQLGNTVSTLNNMTLANVTVTSGNVTITNVTVTTANVTTANIATAVITTANVTTANITTGNVSGNLTFTGTGNRITGDFSNATLANRVLFQTSTVNGATTVTAIPNGTSTTAAFGTVNSSDVANGSFLNMLATSTEASFRNAITGTGTYLPMTFHTGGSERMRIDTAGNLGLGVTPSAWASGTFPSVLQLKYGAFAGTGDGNFRIFTNTVYDGSYKYIANGFASRFELSSGGFIAFTAASGTAGNAITFTQAMTLDASGNLGIGTTSPQSRLHVSDAVAGGQLLVTTNETNSTSKIGSLATMHYTNSEEPVLAISVEGGASENIVQVGGGPGEFNAATVIKFSTAANTTTTGGTERARITSGGFFKSSNTGTYIGSTGAYHELISDSTNSVAYIRNTNASPTGLDLSYSAASPNGTGNPFLYCQDSTALRASIRSNGGLANYSANNVNLSDRREKTNFAPAKNYLDVICAIPVQTFNYLDQNVEDDPGLTLGVVAQDVQEVAPELVMESNWGTEEEPKMRLSIYQTDLQYALMKSIQELKAIVDAQAAEIAALKGNA